MFQVDIRYTLNIDFRVTQDGFRPTLLSTILKKSMFLKMNKKLEFFISYIDDTIKI